LALLMIAYSIGMALLLVPREVVRVEPRVTTQTKLRTSTVLSTLVLTMTSVELKTSTGLQITTVEGESPNVVIVSQQWNPPALILYLQNFGGSGTITLLVFVNGYSGRQKFHIPAYQSLTLNIRFPSYPYVGVPTVQITAQEPDSVVQTQTIETPWAQTFISYETRTLASELLWPRTQLLTISTTIRESKRILEMIVGLPMEPYATIVILTSVAAGSFGVALFVTRLKPPMLTFRKGLPRAEKMRNAMPTRYEIKVLVEDVKKVVRLEVEPHHSVGSLVDALVSGLKVPKGDYVLLLGEREFDASEYSRTLQNVGVKDGDKLKLVKKR